MTRRQPAEPRRPTLQVTRAEAETRIREQIEKGQKLLESQIRSDADLEQVRSEKRKWSDFNGELLRRIVDTDDLVNDYYPLGGFVSTGGRASLSVRAQDLYSDIREYISRLESIHDRLGLIPESPDLVQPTKARPILVGIETSRRVFVVHGHDEEAKQSVARCLERLDLEAVVLHEQPNQGRTIIEKFEDYADAGFAVALLTPDDVGAVKTDAHDLKSRARQNVVFELGFFIGRLGRQRVCALHRGDVEIPSDFSGVLWVPMDPSGAWRFALGRELKAAGLDVDLNRLA